MCLICYLILIKCVAAYKPVIFIHGVMSDDDSLLPMAQKIQEVRTNPGANFYISMIIKRKPIIGLNVREQMNEYISLCYF